MNTAFFFLIIFLAGTAWAAPKKAITAAEKMFQEFTSKCPAQENTKVPVPFPHVGASSDPSSILKTQDDLTSFNLASVHTTLPLTSRLSLDSGQLTHLDSYKHQARQLYIDLTEGSVEGLISPNKQTSLQSLWLIVGEKNETQYVSESRDFEFTPTEPGRYAGQLILKETSENGLVGCRTREFEISVSHNPDPIYQNQTLNLQLNSDDLKWQQELKLSEAHTMTRGHGVTIAVLDSGVNYNHLGLSQKIIFDSDSSTGLDLVDNDRLPFDGDGHGTHTAGLIVGDLIGVAPDAKVIPYRIANNLGKANAKSLYLALKDAVNRNVDLINISMSYRDLEFLGIDYLPLINQVIEQANQKGILIIVAAGNGDILGLPINLDRQNLYLAAFNSPNIVVVGARGSKHQLTSYSNYGYENVDIVAFGGDPIDVTGEISRSEALRCDGKCRDVVSFGESSTTSTLRLHGTSMATPIVTGALALLKSHRPNAKSQDLLKALFESADKYENYQNRIKTGGELNILKALKALK